jgi:hypothetical protein
MDLPTIIFVVFIFLASLLLTLLIRRDIHDKAQLRRELRHLRRQPARQRARLGRRA